MAVPHRRGDLGLGRVLGLRKPATRFTRTRVRVPMRDGVELLADHYAPVGAAAGTVLVRCPYGRGLPNSVVFARLYAARGYHVVLQSVRGTFGSGGVFTPMVHEVADGADTVDWLRRQPWFTGTFATIGLSYLGFTQWALLTDPPPELTAAVIAAGPHDFSATSWGTGAFALNDFLGWSDLMAHQEGAGRARLLWSRRRVRRTADRLPAGAAARAMLGDRARWYESWLAHPDPADPFWEPLRVPAALDRAAIPVLLIGGWQDLFAEQTLHQYRRLRERGVPVALTMGPWTHSQMLTSGLGTLCRESLAWLDTHLAGGPDTRAQPVRVRVTGAGWAETGDLPAASARQVLHLHPGRLAAAAPQPGAVPASFRFDPADPTPTVGGRLLSPDSGYREDRRLAERADVLTFTGEMLTADLTVTGRPVVELDHGSDNPHADLFVRLGEVHPDGRSLNVADGYLRLTGRTGPVRLELDTVAHRFSASSRIRLLIAGGCHPRFARNLGTGEPVVSGTALRPATHTVAFGASRLLLPVGAPGLERH
ncbi:CocE/NonD family hydrolase [Mycolicibacillus trivialis]